MADIVDRATRSRMMAGIRGKDTKLEVALRRALHQHGFRFRKNVPDMLGKQDVVLKRYCAAIFAHGCFWHGHDCHLFRLSATRTDFWRTKIEENRERDVRAIEALRGQGWCVLTVWECAFRGKTHLDFELLIARVISWIIGSDPEGEIEGVR